METKKSKYDTNPLDPDFVKKADEQRSDQKAAETQEVAGATRQIRSSENDATNRNVYSEAPTQRYDTVSPNAPYPSIFVPPPYSPPTPYQPPPSPYQAPPQRPTSRHIAGIGLPEKWASILPYAPAYIGVVVSLLELFLVPRREPRVRFHAGQGLALHLAIVIIQTLFSVVSAVTGSTVGGKLFGAAATVFLIISMVRVWKGKPHYIAPIAEAAQWFNQKIEPRTK